MLKEGHGETVDQTEEKRVMHRIARALAILGCATALATAPSAKGEPHEFTQAGDANLVFDPGAGVCRLEEADDLVDRMAIESQRSTTKGTPILFLALYVPCDVLWRHRTLGVLSEYAVLEAQPVPGREAFGSLNEFLERASQELATRQSAEPGARQIEIKRIGSMAVYGITEKQVVVRGFPKTTVHLTALTLLHDHVVIYKVATMYGPNGSGREQAVTAIRSAAERAMSDLTRRNRPRRTAVKGNSDHRREPR